MSAISSVNDNVLKALESLHPSIVENLSILLVEREGNAEDSFMRTENILGAVEPWCTYRLEKDGFYPDHDLVPNQMPTPQMPPNVKFAGDWISEIDRQRDGSNILGGYGRYLSIREHSCFEIPEAETTAEHLAEYDCRLIKWGEGARFKSNAPLPITVMQIGKNYAKDYLLKLEGAGGAYLEIHDRPHFHMPLNKDADGYLLIGKYYDDGVRKVSAFKIPFGYGVLMEPWVIHCDAFLVGRYMVIFSATPEFSTVILRNSAGNIVDVDIKSSHKPN